MASLVIGALPLATKALSLSSTLSSSRSKTPIAVSVSLSTSASSTSPPFIYCGREDKKNAKGKRLKHSFGNPPRAPVSPLPSRKDRFDDRDEKIEIEIDGPLFS